LNISSALMMVLLFYFTLLFADAIHLSTFFDAARFLRQHKARRCWRPQRQRRLHPQRSKEKEAKCAPARRCKRTLSFHHAT